MTQWLSVKEKKHTLYSEKSALGPFVLEMSVCSKLFSLIDKEMQVYKIEDSMRGGKRVLDDLEHFCEGEKKVLEVEEKGCLIIQRVLEKEEKGCLKS